MSFYDAIRLGASGTAGAYEVERSLRFNTTDQTEVTNTSLGTSPTSRKISTLSVWFKRNDFSTGFITYGYSGSGASQSLGGARFVNSERKLSINNEVNNSTVWSLVTNREFRDFSAWYHLVVAINTTEGTASDRVKVYINGVQETSFSTANYPSQNYDNLWLYSKCRVGATDGGGGYYAGFNGYIAEYHAIDGQALTPASFGETDATTGQWNPIEYKGTYGTNGHYLNFSDNSDTTATTLGKDSSGNGKNFTPSNLSVSAGTGNDSMKDTPTNNFATLNANLPIGSSSSYKNGNLEFHSATSAQRQTRSTFAHNSGKWYAEFKLVSFSHTHGSYPYIGVAASNTFSQNWVGDVGTAVNRVGTAYKDGSSISGGFSYTTGDIIGMALDVDNLLVYFYKNGTIQNSGTGFAITANPNKGYQFAASIWATAVWAANFGAIGIGSNSDANGHGNFSYAVPSGYLAECSANLPDPTILLPNEHFDIKLWTGNSASGGSGTTQTISGLNFGPDWLWIKRRDGTSVHSLNDTVRGVNKQLNSEDSAGETSYANRIGTFNSDGFILGADGDVNFNNATYVGWVWNAGNTEGKTYTVTVVSDSGNKYRFDGFGTSAVTLDLAEGGTYIFNMDNATNATHPFSIGTAANGTVYSSGITYFLDGVPKTYSEYTSGFSGASTRRLHITVPASAPPLYYWCSAHSGMGGAINTNTSLGSSNFDGTTQSVVKVNTTAGFSIVLYTGTGSNTNIGHGLGVAPQVVFTKSRSASGSWGSLQTVGDPNAEFRLHLNDNGGYSSYQAGNLWNDTVPTSTHFRVGSDASTNASGVTYVAYVFSEVEGYSKFGKYTGNGDNDGMFVYTGFKVKWLLIKRTTSESWIIADTARNSVSGRESPADSYIRPDSGLAESTGIEYDLLSNGFKFKSNSQNESSSTYIYYAFSESPFKNARAR